ncbi:MAG TPA: succinate--CoA ligase subunit alpha, partial [Candidatus Acidoferrum sp.]|nr:succinate--CoA ligase subunit alpha [Candidatus Acidoferrum sp.]
GDPVKGYSFVDLLPLFAEDPETQAIVLIGEIGGTDEERAAGWLERNRIGKPVIAYVVGRTAPPFVKMGHPGTLFVKNDRSYAEKAERLRAAKVVMAWSPWEVAAHAHAMLGR